MTGCIQLTDVPSSDAVAETLAPPEPGRPPRPWLLPFISAVFSLQSVGGLGFRRNLTFFFRPEGPGRATPSSRSAAARAPMRAKENPAPEGAMGRDLILPGSPSCRSPGLSPAGRLHRPIQGLPHGRKGKLACRAEPQKPLASPFISAVFSPLTA